MNNEKSHGFSLLEMLIVVAIISLLAGMVAPNLLGRVDEAKIATARSDMNTIMQALEMYYLDNHRYPDTQSGLDVLVAGATVSNRSGPDGKRSYLRTSAVPADPWGREYLYLSPGEHGEYDLYSFGADGKQGGEGQDADILSWDL